VIQGTRPFAALAVLIATALAALLLVACGSNSDSSETPSATTNGAGTSAEESSGSQGGTGSQGSQGNGSAPDQAGQNGEQGGNGPSDEGPKQHTVAEVSVPLKVSGGGSKQFYVKNGDNSIQEFGEEGSEAELEEAAKAVHTFFVARAAGHWSEACSLMSASLTERLVQLAAKSSGVQGCGAFLEAFTTELPAAAWRELTTMDAGSLRQEGEQGFLIYTGPGGTVYSMPLRDEDGQWKVTSLSATELLGA